MAGSALAWSALPLAAQAAPPPTSGEETRALSPPTEAPGEPPVELGPGASPWFPGTRLFRPPMAAPLEPGFRGAAVSTDLLRGDTQGAERPPPEVGDLRPGGRDFQGIVSLGESYPVRRFGRGRTGVQVGIQVGVTARFRLATSANEYVASDWVVGLPVEFARRGVEGRFLLFHRSAHLGDEIMERAGVGRVGFGHEGATLLLATARSPGDPGGAQGGGVRPLRGYAGVTRILRSETSGTLEELGRGWDDGWEMHAGAELERGIPATGSPLAGFVAVDLTSAERTNWQTQWGVLAGTSFRVGSRSGRAALRWLHGPSMHGEFFLTPETAWGLEFRLTR